MKKKKYGLMPLQEEGWLVVSLQLSQTEYSMYDIVVYYNV